ncbi:cytochrome P450 [Streptomyces laurentii]|uniref:cytochrome P450 n=1 Tax=Streptomyces laurentii TaxID=39478 RepID=UPI0036851CDB
MAIQTTEWTSPPDTEAELLAWLDAMRELDPVQRDPDRGGWHVFGHAECVEALTNHSAFSSVLAADVPEDSPMTIFRIGNLSWMDPPRHQVLRSLVRHVFTPRYVAGLEPMISGTVERFLAEIEGKEQISFIEEYAAPVAAAVIANMLGIPDEDRDLFGRWTAALMSIADPTLKKNEVGTIIGYTRDIKVYLKDLVQDRRRAPQDDFITRLTSVEVDGETLTDDEIMGLICLLLLTGQTTTQSLANAVICLDQNPDADQALRADLSLCNSTLEEVIRYRAQTSRVARVTTREVKLGRHVIPEGQPVSVWLAAANFDPVKFPDPEVFDLKRHPNQHIALGHGVHFCLGAPLARMESSIALEGFIKRTSSVSVDYEQTTLLDPRLVFGANTLMINASW